MLGFTGTVIGMIKAFADIAAAGDISPQIVAGGIQVALITTGGSILLDGRAAEIEFETTGVIVPEMTIEGGALSGLSIDG